MSGLSDRRKRDSNLDWVWGLTLLLWDSLITLLTIIMAYMKVMVGCVPVINEFSVKFNPISREDSVSKSFRVLFAKLHEESSSPGPDAERLDSISYPQASMLRPGCSDQIAKMLFPLNTGYDANAPPQEYPLFINLPVVPQPNAHYSYKVVVATAPPHIKLSGAGSEPVVIYVVFPDNDTDGMSTRHIKIPTIYFVSKNNGDSDLEKKEKVDPILIVDSNRTVTGLKSNDVAKFVKFKSKFSERIDTAHDATTTKTTDSSTSN